MRSEQRISCLIPVRDGERFLGDAIRSALEQTLPVDEILVVDDGSVDGSAEVAEGFGDPVRLIRQQQAGPGAARNNAIGQARGELLGFLDADDLWMAAKLELQVAHLKASPGDDVVIGMVESFIDPVAAGDPQVEKWLMPPIAGYVWSSGLFRRDCFERFGPLQEAVGAGQLALAWFQRARRAGIAIGAVEPVVARRRLHGANITFAHDSMDGMLTLLKAGIDERRS